jgi:hypothetical protein
MTDPFEIEGTVDKDKSTKDATRKVKKATFSIPDKHPKKTTQSSVSELESDDASKTSILEVTDKNFYDEVIKSEKDVLIKFYTAVPTSFTRI